MEFANYSAFFICSKNVLSSGTNLKRIYSGFINFYSFLTRSPNVFSFVTFLADSIDTFFSVSVSLIFVLVDKTGQAGQLHGGFMLELELVLMLAIRPQ